MHSSFKILLVLCAFSVVTLSCGIKDGPYLPLQILPKPVRKFKVLARSGGVILRWRMPKENTDDSPLFNLGGVRIFRADTGFENICLSCPRAFRQIFDYNYVGPVNKVPETEMQYYRDSSLQFKYMYTYRLQTYNDHGDSAGPADAVDVYWDVPPGKPENVRAGKTGRLTTVYWDPPLSLEDGSPAEGICGFNLYRSEKSGEEPFFPLNAEVIRETAIEDIPAEDEKVYFYSVRAVRKVKDTYIESASSREVMVSYMDITPPGVPKGLAAIPVDRGVLLKWVPKAEKDFKGFNVYRKDAKGKAYVKLNRKLVLSNSWIDVSAKIKHGYIYAVTSVDASAAANESGFSEPVKIFYILK